MGCEQLINILLTSDQVFLWISIVVAIAFLLLFYFQRKSSSNWTLKKRLKLVHKNKSFDRVQIIRRELSDPNKDFPISDEEINLFLEKAKENFSYSLLGIERILLEDRRPELPMSINGSYQKYDSFKSKFGSIIRIYPMEKVDDKYKLYFLPSRDNFPQDSSYYILLNKEEAKSEMLHTLGHEIGHSIIYNSEERLFGEDVERKCDLWAEVLGAKSIVDEKGLINKRMIYQDGKPVGYRKDLLAQKDNKKAQAQTS